MGHRVSAQIEGEEVAHGALGPVDWRVMSGCGVEVAVGCIDGEFI